MFEKISAFFKDNGLDMKRVCMLVTDWGSMHGRKSEWFGSAVVGCCTSDENLTLHCSSDCVVCKTKRRAQNDNGQRDGYN